MLSHEAAPPVALLCRGRELVLGLDELRYCPCPADGLLSSRPGMPIVIPRKPVVLLTQHFRSVKASSKFDTATSHFSALNATSIAYTQATTAANSGQCCSARLPEALCMLPLSPPLPWRWWRWSC